MLLFSLSLGTSVLAGFAIFSILGHMAHIYKMPVSEVVKEGQTHTAHEHQLVKMWETARWPLMFDFFDFVQDLAWHSLLIQMLCLNFLFPLCGLFCSSSCF